MSKTSTGSALRAREKRSRPIGISRVIKGILLGAILVGYCSSAIAGWDESWAAYHRGDHASAVTEWKSLAEQGDATAQQNVAYAYYSGLGVEQDAAEALRWYLMAAKQGHSGAQLNVGVMFLNGEGVEPDGEEALKWFQRAYEQGETKAAANIGAVYIKGVLDSGANYALGLEWFLKAARHGHIRSQETVGRFYNEGLGTDRNIEKARHWWKLAAEAGSKDAAAWLAELPPPSLWYAVDVSGTDCIKSGSPADRIRLVQQGGIDPVVRDLPGNSVEVGYHDGLGQFRYWTFYRSMQQCVASLPRAQPIPNRYE